MITRILRLKSHFTEIEITLPKVDVTQRDNDGKTALDLASEDDNEDENADGNVSEALRSRGKLLELGHTC